MARSVLRLADQRRDVFPHRCVLSGIHTDSAMRMTVTTWQRAGGRVTERTERRSVDERPHLHTITNPVLVMAGELDPICPIETSQEIAEALPASLARFERFANCGHGVFRDNPERAFAVLRDFITT